MDETLSLHSGACFGSGERINFLLEYGAEVRVKQK
jgi:hypothetical protein